MYMGHTPAAGRACIYIHTRAHTRGEKIDRHISGRGTVKKTRRRDASKLSLHPRNEKKKKMRVIVVDFSLSVLY